MCNNVPWKLAKPLCSFKLKSFIKLYFIFFFKYSFLIYESSSVNLLKYLTNEEKGQKIIYCSVLTSSQEQKYGRGDWELVYFYWLGTNYSIHLYNLSQWCFWQSFLQGLGPTNLIFPISNLLHFKTNLNGFWIFFFSNYLKNWWNHSYRESCWHKTILFIKKPFQNKISISQMLRKIIGFYVWLMWN